MSEINNSSNTDLFEDICDDVCEQILGYLPFKDKTKLEGVSKQWQTCIYRQQRNLNLFDSETPPEYESNTLNKLLKPIEFCDYFTLLADSKGWKQIKKLEFENILKRCPFIRNIALLCFCDDNDLLLIGKYLENVEILVCNLHCITKNGLLEFGRKYGHKLKELRFEIIQYRNEIIKEFLNYCPNIELINFADSSAYYSEDKSFLPKLEKIYCFKVRLGEQQQDIENFKRLTEKYGNTMKELDINVQRFGLIVMPYISSLVNLQKLALKLNYFDDEIDDNQQQNIDYHLRQLSENCGKLKNLSFIWIDSSRVLPVNLFKAFSMFCSVITLDIRILSVLKVIECKSEYFKSCTNLKHLRLSYSYIRDAFFKNIGQHIPNLRSIDLNTEKAIRNESLISLSALKKLKKLLLRQHQFSNEFITDIGIHEIINSCNDIEDIWFKARPKITNETIDNLKEIATQRTRKSIKFRCDLSDSRDELQFEQQIDINRLKDLPNNLKINILMEPINVFVEEDDDE